MKRVLPVFLCLPLLFIDLNATQTSESKSSSYMTMRVSKKKSGGYGKKVSRLQKTETRVEKCCGYNSKAFAPMYSVKSIGVDGETLVMNDETVWQVAPSSAYIASTWVQNTPITISPARWYSKYQYYLTNVATQEVINVKLSQGPFLQNMICVTNIEFYKSLVYLSDGSVWRVTSPELRTWDVGQAVLLGVNTGWIGQSHILININENQYVEAKFLQ